MKHQNTKKKLVCVKWLEKGEVKSRWDAEGGGYF